MLDESLRRRLESLNRSPLPAERGDILLFETRTRCSRDRQPKSRMSPFSVSGLLQRGEVAQNDAGEHLQIRLPLEQLWPGGKKLVEARQQHLQQLLRAAEVAVEPAVAMDAEFAALVAALPDRLLLLDLETCGLAGAALFLVGLLRLVDGEPTVELLFARNYAEEPAVLESLWQTLPAHDVLATFNGKSFDWPMVLERSTRYLMGRTGPTKITHVDVLHHARRRWRRRLPDCRLQTLEQYICRRSRTGDIPGHRIPSAYAEYVRTGFERDMDAVLYHNAMDLVTLLDLALRLAA